MMLVSRWRSGAQSEVYLERGNSRISLRLSEFIGEGNSAEAFSIADEKWSQYVVAKIYLPGKKPDYLKSIVEEARIRNIGGLGGRGADTDGGWYSPLATPKAVLYPSAESSEPCGLLVTKIDSARFETLDRFLQTPMKNDLMITSFAAECLAEIVAWLHDKGYVVGDFSGTNIRVDSTGHVCLLDVDSFGIVGIAGNDYFVPSADSSRNYLAPESAAGGQTDQESDRFVLAMLASQLLLGVTPFAGVEAGRRDSSTQDNINRGKSWLFSPGEFVLPARFREHPGLAMLPASTGQLARRGLAEAGQRPTAAEWVTELRAIRQGLEQCQCGGRRFAGAACPSCRSGSVLAQKAMPLPTWSYPQGTSRRGRARQETEPGIPVPVVYEGSVPGPEAEHSGNLALRIILTAIAVLVIGVIVTWSLLS